MIDKLRAFVRKYYQNLLIRGLIFCFSSLSIGVLLFSALEYFGNFGVLTRTLLFWLFAILSGTLLVLFVLIPVLKLAKLTRQLTDDEAAKIIGRHFPEVEDRLLNVLQLKKQNNASLPLLEASIIQKASELRPIPFVKAVDFFENKRHLKYILVPVVVVCALYLSGSVSIITESSARIIDHQTEYTPPQPFEVRLSNDKLECVQHQDFLLQIQITGREIPTQAFVERGGLSIKMKKKPNHLFEYVFRNVQKTEYFALNTGGVKSKEYRLNVLPAPSISRFHLEVDYPHYTGILDEKLTNVGEVVVPEGTYLSWVLHTENTDSISVLWGAEKIQARTASANQFSFSRQPKKSLSYVLLPSNNSVASSDSMSYQVKVLKDGVPLISAREVVDSTSSKTHYFKGEISDDYGFDKLQFRVKKQSNEWDSIVPIKVDKKLKQSSFFFVFDRASIPIQGGDLLEYYFEVFDNDAVNGSKKTKSKIFDFQAPTRDELLEEHAQTTEKLKDQLSENVVLAKELQRDLEKLQKTLLSKQNMTWEDQEFVNEVLEKQKKLEKNIQQISLKNKEKNAIMSEFLDQDKRILEKQKQLEELMEDLMSDELRELFEEMDSLAEEMSTDEWMDKLEELQLSNEDLEKELDRNLEMLKKLEFEQALEESMDKLEQIKFKQEQLSQSHKPIFQQAEEQESINNSFDELREKLDALHQKNNELDRPQTLSELKQLEELIDQKLKENLENIQKNKRKKTQQSQKETIDLMEKALAEMEDSQAETMDQSPPEDMVALRQILENLIDLSLQEEALLVDLSQTQKNDPNYVSIIHWQNKLSDDSKILVDSLYALSRRQAQLKATVNREVNAMNSNIQKSLEHMAERETKKALGRQQLVMTSANNLALMLSDILQAMQEDAADGMPGNQQCNKPGRSNPSPGDLKKMQQDLKDQLERMKNGQQKSPGEKPGMSQSKSLVKMMQRQELIRQQLEKLADGMGEQDNGSLESLQEAIRQMEKTEEDLSKNQISNETLNRQNQIIERLLEAEKADQERGKDKKRESKEAKQLPHQVKDLMEDYQQKKMKQAELLKTIPPALKPYYKEKVNEYFRHLDKDE